MKTPDADLELHVKTPTTGGVTHLRYVLHSDVLGYSLEPFDGQEFRGRPEDYQARLLGNVEKLGRRLGSDGSQLTTSEVVEELEKVGRQLYTDLFPPRLKDAYRRIREDERVTTLLIVSDEPWIPWELVKPFDSEAFDDDFLCCRFELTRWLTGERPPEEHVGSGHVACIEAGKALKDNPLSHAQAESRLLAELARRHTDVRGFVVADATYADVQRVLRSGGHGVIHFIGHGEFNVADPDASPFFLLDGRSWRPRDLLDPAIGSRLRQDRPLVFFASCQTARQAWALTRLGGWAARWLLDGGCGAFVAPQWSVGDASSCLFVKTFYETLEKGATIAKAALTARRKVRAEHPSSSSWLAFTVYAHPRGRISFEPVPTRVYFQCQARLRGLDDGQLAVVAKHLNDETVDPGSDRQEQCQKLLHRTSQRGEKGWMDLQESILEVQSPLSLSASETSESWIQRPQRSWQVDRDEWVALGMDAIPWVVTSQIPELREAVLLTWEGMGFRDGRLEARIWLPLLGQGAAAGLMLRYVERHHAVLAVLRGTEAGTAFLELWQREGSALKLLASDKLPPNRSQRRLWIELTGQRVRTGADETGPIEARLAGDVMAGSAGVTRFGPGVVRFQDLCLTVVRRSPDGRESARSTQAEEDIHDGHSTY